MTGHQASPSLQHSSVTVTQGQSRISQQVIDTEQIARVIVTDFDIPE